MALGLIGTKIGMTQVYEEDGSATPVTVLQLGPCPILQVRTLDRDEYEAIQLGYKDKPQSKASRAERGHVRNDLISKRRAKRNAADIPVKANCEPQRLIREFRLKPTAELQVGKALTVAEVFKDIYSVDVIGTSKGRGYSGVIKRHGFGGLPAAHGAKKVHREVGSTASLGSNRGTGRPKKGKRLPGQYGASQVTIRNLRVVKIDADNHLLMVKGAVPGHPGAYVMVRPTNVKPTPKAKPKDEPTGKKK